MSYDTIFIATICSLVVILVLICPLDFTIEPSTHNSFDTMLKKSSIQQCTIQYFNNTIASCFGNYDCKVMINNLNFNNNYTTLCIKRFTYLSFVPLFIRIILTIFILILDFVQKIILIGFVACDSAIQIIKSIL